MSRKSTTAQKQQDESLLAIEELYTKHADERPDTDVDKQILAAMRRELSNPREIQLPIKPSWKRLILPLYVMTIFTFSVIALHWFWPSPTWAPEETLLSPVSVDLTDQKVEAKAKKQRSLPKKQLVMQLPESPKTESQIEGNNQLEQELQLGKSYSLEEKLSHEIKLKTENIIENQQEEKRLKSATSQPNNSALSYPDKEKWVRDIIEMFKQGKYEKAHGEVIRFKKVYPDYPLDEQIEPFKR